MRIDKFTVGADPELFIVNREIGEIVSAIGLIPGKKGNPYKPDDMPEGYGLQTDNVLAEFNIPPVTKCDDFIHHIEYMKSYIRNYLKKKNVHLDISCQSSGKLLSKYLNNKQAQEIGCDRDLNAYTGEFNPKIDKFPDQRRVSGFHIHVGYDDFNIEDSIKLVKYLDIYLGLPSVLIDSDNERRKLYGRAGSFRTTPYGLEYRVLGGYMMSSPYIGKFLWKQLEKAIDAFNKDAVLMKEEEVENVINDSLTDGAQYLIDKYNICEFC